jgi:outer membrane protein assembly factor BamB
VSGAGSFDINIFSPWFESDSDVDTPDVVNASPPFGEIPVDFTTDPANPLSDVWLVNYEYITGTRPDNVTMRDEAYSYAISGTSLAVDIAGSSFLAEAGERVVLAVEPIGLNQDIAEGGDLVVARDARFFFPAFNGAININRVDYAYERLVDDEANNRVILENVTASQFPNTLPTFPSPILSRGSGGSPYDGDFVILSPRNYMVMAEGTSDEVTWGDAYALGMNVYDHEIRPESQEPDFTAEDFVTDLSKQEPPSSDFFGQDLTNYVLNIGGGGTNEFGSAFYNATRNIGGERDYCQQGACLFGLGIRTYFLVDFISQGDGITFTLLNAADNTASSAGGDVDLPELMGYAGDSRTNSGGTTFLATNVDDRGLDPPKIAVEFDTRVNNDTLAYCDNGSVNQNTRDDDDPLNDPDLIDQDVVQYIFWGRENLDLSCRSGPKVATYDDNRHGPGLWQFDDPAGKVKSSPAVDPSTGTIYVGSNDNKLYAISRFGIREWSFTTGGYVISSPAIGPDGTIYVGSNDSKVYAIRPGGTKRWEFDTGAAVRSSPTAVEETDGTTTIYIGSDDGKMYALVDDGTTTVAQRPGWPFDAGAGVPFSLGHPAIGSDRTIYFSALNTVYARNPDGSEKWTEVLGARPGADNVYMPSVDTVAGFGFVYTDVPGNAIAALNPANGNEVWRVSVNADFDSTPVVGPDGTIYLGTDDNNPALFAVTPASLSGSIKWEFPTGDEVDNIPALSPDGSVVYVVSNDGNLYAVDTAIGPDPSTGDPLWSFAIVTDTADSPANVTSSPAVDPTTGNIYVGSDDTNVYALTPFDEEPRNEQGLLLTNDDLGGDVTSEVNWLNSKNTKGPWAVRLEINRGLIGDYELRLWMKQCDNATCDTLNGADDPFFKDTRVIYQVSAPDLVQFFQLDALDNAKFDRFLFGFAAAAGVQALNVNIINFTQSFIRFGDPIIGP